MMKSDALVTKFGNWSSTDGAEDRANRSLISPARTFVSFMVEFDVDYVGGRVDEQNAPAGGGGSPLNEVEPS